MNDRNEMLEGMADLSTKLNEQSAELNNAFHDVERQLNSLHLGVSGWAKQLIGVRKEHNVGYRFGFCRLDKADGWKLVCRKVSIENDHENDIYKDDGGYGLLRPITTMPRSIRVEASHLIEEVIQEVFSKAKDYADDISSAVCNLSKAKETLGEIPNEQ